MSRGDPFLPASLPAYKVAGWSGGGTQQGARTGPGRPKYKVGCQAQKSAKVKIPWFYSTEGGGNVRKASLQIGRWVRPAASSCLTGMAVLRWRSWSWWQVRSFIPSLSLILRRLCLLPARCPHAFSVCADHNFCALECRTHLDEAAAAARLGRRRLAELHLLLMN